MNSRKNKHTQIVLLGYIVRGPLGGLAWHHLQYVVGFCRQGYQVLFLEEGDTYPSCYHPVDDTLTTDPSYGIQFITDLFQQYAPAASWAYHDVHTGSWYGLSKTKVTDFCSHADMLINLSGVNLLNNYTHQIPERILLDTDPVFTQVRHIGDSSSRMEAEKHNHFFSFGENFGRTACTIPDDGFNWLPTRQPIVLDLWPATPGRPQGAWTTVMQWSSYKAVVFNQTRYGMKKDSFDPYLDLPKRSAETFELAIGSPGIPYELLIEHGWQLRNAPEVTRSPSGYQEFIRKSKAEWSVAKQGYVISNSGWFSERSCCYLASGRPALLQDTGFSECIDTGRGLLAFRSPEECLLQLKNIEEDYHRHCTWARELAAEFFGHEKVLDAMLKHIS